MFTTDEKIDAGLYVQDQGVIANFDLVLFVFHTRSSKVFLFLFFLWGCCLVCLFVLTQDFRILSTQAN